MFFFVWNSFPKNYISRIRLRFRELHGKIVWIFLGKSLFRYTSSRKRLYTPPPSPHIWPKGIFKGEEGGGVYILSPRAAGILYAPPLFIRPPPLEGYFWGWGGGGV